MGECERIRGKTRGLKGDAMTSPSIRRFTVEEAEQELAALEAQIDGDPEEFEWRAHNYTLSPRERGLWQQIADLRWMLSRAQ